MNAGRYAPSPSGDLHIGNLRTAMLAWLFAKQTGRAFYLRFEDIDSERTSASSASRQLEDLSAIGIDFNPPVIHQSQRSSLYEAALSRLPVYECYCSRRDIREAAGAPHQMPNIYPGTCRNLTDEQRAYKRQQLRDEGRVPSLRLRAEVQSWTVQDFYAGTVTGPVDDVVVRRGGYANQSQAGDWAYNLAAVVDDGEQGIDQVVRGNDLLDSSFTQAYIATLLGYEQPSYVHVPLVVGPDDARLAKRDGSVTLRDIGDTRRVVQWISRSIGCEDTFNASELVQTFTPEGLSPDPYTWTGL